MYRFHLFTIKLFLLGGCRPPNPPAVPGGLPAPQTLWRGACSPYREAPPLGLSVFSWYQDFGNPLTCGCVAAGVLFSEKWPPYFWKPLTCGYVATGTFFQEKRPPCFWKPPACGYVAAVFFCFLFRKTAPRFLEAPNLWVRCRRCFFQKNIFLEALLNPKSPAFGGSGIRIAIRIS